MSDVTFPENQLRTAQPELAEAAVELAPVSAAACSARSWPNYDQSCLRHLTSELRRVRSFPCGDQVAQRLRSLARVDERSVVHGGSLGRHPPLCVSATRERPDDCSSW